MQKSVLPWLTGVLIVSILFTTGETVAAQVFNFPCRSEQEFFTDFYRSWGCIQP